jgi:YggT family protein
MFGSRHYYDDDDVQVRRARFDRTRPQRLAAGVSRLVNVLFGIVYAIIGLRIVLEALGAREGNRFKEFVDRLSAPLVGVFEGLLPRVHIGQFELALSLVFALLIYALVHYGIRRLIWGLARLRSPVD